MKIGNREISDHEPTYFIADIAANHDGDLQRALDLMYLAKQAGADAAKFQHFRSDFIVSDLGFRSIGKQLAHQALWDKPVSEVYANASLNWKWTSQLKQYADSIGIDFFTSPYDFGAVDHVDPFVDVFKIGSGDVTWLEIIDYIAAKGKPVILATGASSLSEVKDAVTVINDYNVPYCVMQCNTNYTGSEDNLKYLNINVLGTYRREFPDAVLGLSDHTHGHVSVLGAVALGARIIEKHFTDDNDRDGPDHAFSMTTESWREMVLRTKDLEECLGSDIKVVENNETESLIVQRRGLRASRPISKGSCLTREDITVLRPVYGDTVPANKLNQILGIEVAKDIEEGVEILWTDLLNP
jgi:sialic acid synthase SpsE